MPITFRCPKCNTAFRVADESAGKLGRCSKCGNEIKIPVVQQTGPQVQSGSAPARHKSAEATPSATQIPPVVNSPTRPIPNVPSPVTQARRSRLTYNALTAGVLLFLVGRLIQTPANATPLTIVLNVLITAIIWFVTLGMIALIPAARHIKALWLSIFAWLLLAAAVFDVGVGAYAKFIVEPEVKAIIAGLNDDTNLFTLPQAPAATAPVATQPAQPATPRPTGSIPREDRIPPRKVETVVFDTTGRNNAKGVQMKLSYPRTWKAEEGDRPATVQRFISDGGRGNQAVLIQTFARTAPYDRELTESEKRLFLAREQVLEAYGNGSRILSHSITTLDGKTCAKFELEQVLDTGGFKVGVKTVNIAVPLKRSGLLISCYVRGDASTGFDAINREFDAAKPLFMDIVDSCIFADERSASTRATNQSYVNVRLAHGMSLSIPTSWYVFDNDWNALIRQNAIAMSGDISGMSERKNFGYSTILRITTRPKQLYGSLAINVYDTPLLSPDDIAEIAESADSLELLRQVIHNEIASQAPASLVGDTSISSLHVNGHPAVRFSYQRKSIHDDRIVQCYLMRVFLTDKTYSIVWSYGAAEKELLAPILDGCIKSISVAE